MIVPTFARRPIVGYSWVVLAAVGTGFLSFGLWVHHMFTTGLPGISLGAVLGGVDGGRDPDRRADLLLPRHAAGRPRSRDRCRCSSSSAASSTFVLGGLTGVMVAHRAVRLPGARHLLHRRPSALRADRRRRLSDRRRRLLLLPAGQRQAALRAARATLVLADVRRLQRRRSCRCTSPACAACRAASSPIRRGSASTC